MDDDFLVTDVDLPEPAEGQVVLRTLYLSLDPYMRGRMSEAKSYAPPVGLGEVMVFVFFGLVAVMGTTYVQTRTWDDVGWASLAAGTGVGALACAILVANNLRDIPTDVEAGKRTLAVVLGDARSRQFYAALVGLSAVLAVALAVGATPWALLALPGLLPAAPALRAVLSGAGGPALVPVLKATGVAELLWSAGLALGLVLGR